MPAGRSDEADFSFGKQAGNCTFREADGAKGLSQVNNGLTERATITGLTTDSRLAASKSTHKIQQGRL